LRARQTVWGLMAVACSAGTAGAAREATPEARVAARPPMTGGNRHYTGSRPPLAPAPLLKLPVGAVRPEGWLRRQLELMADGFTGRLPELSGCCRFEDSAWADPRGRGRNGWEELPYWLKGYVVLGHVLGDVRIQQEARRWIEAILRSQRPDGWFGPESNRAAPDLWPNMLAVDVLRSHFEATGDNRVPPFLKRYFRWQARLPLERFLPADWQKWRGGDNLAAILWLYDRTAEKWLLDLARVNHERTADWVGGIPTWHGVNICQGFREPAQYWQLARDRRYWDAAERNYRIVMERYGQVPGGMFGADENARPGFNGPRQAAETCSMAEMMHSHELLLALSGDPAWADRCEEVAFNSLPASMTPDLKALHYLTAPNMVQLDRQSKAPLLQNGGDMFSYDPESYRCCQHNAAFAWPYFAERLWMATAGDGLAAPFYAASTVRARVGDGAEVAIREETDYPFGDSVQLTVSASRPVSFPLSLRIPGWCGSPGVSVNGRALPVQPGARGWLVLRRTWRGGDRVRLHLPMSIRVTTWENNRGTVSVSRGPLTYSLKIAERWVRWGGADRWPKHEVYPASPWNYGLVLDEAAPARSFTVLQWHGGLPDQPFTVRDAPVQLRVRARRIPQWVLEPNGLVGEVQPGPVTSQEPEEEVVLIPMGCARLRISAFPRIGAGPDAREWGDSVVLDASHVHDTLAAVADGVIPASSWDQSIPRFTWWDHRGTTEWVEQRFGRPRRVGSCQVYWFNDEVVGGQCRVPQAWKLLWWDGAAWQPIAAGHPAAGDAASQARFAPVDTTAVRLEVRLRPGWSAGILEWKLAP